MRGSRFETTILRVSSLLVGLIAVACGGPEVGDIVGNEVSLTVTAVASASDVAALGEPQGGLGVSRAFVSTSALSLRPCSENSSDLTLGARGYELLQEPSPSERITTASWELCGLQVELAATGSPPDGIPARASLYLEGQDAAGEPFTLTSESEIALLFEPETGSSFGEQPLLLGLDVSVWLSGLPLSAEQADASAPTLDDQLLDAAALYVDANGNHALDEDEQTPVARATRPR